MRATIGWTERDITQMLADFAWPMGLHFLPEDRPEERLRRCGPRARAHGPRRA
jgi:hypothetical protein